MLFDNKYEIISHIGSGAFCDVCLGRNINTNEEVAIKIEKKNIEVSTLQHEAKIYIYLNRINGIPRVKSFGSQDEYNYLILDRLGRSMDTLTKSLSSIPINTLLLVAKDIVLILKEIHERGIIHRDIKPENFLFSYKSSKINIIDFGLSRQYIKCGIHIKNKNRNNLLGTAIFASINNHKGEGLSRRDDLESFIYTIIYCGKGSLPWEHLENKNNLRNEEYNNEILRIKLQTTNEELFYNLEKWKNGAKLLDYVKNLEFEERPDYDKIYKLLE
jgi:serine/threonine protein kinase